jgi:hypothetical protein
VTVQATGLTPYIESQMFSCLEFFKHSGVQCMSSMTRECVMVKSTSPRTKPKRGEIEIDKSIVAVNLLLAKQLMGVDVRFHAFDPLKVALVHIRLLFRRRILG